MTCKMGRREIHCAANFTKAKLSISPEWSIGHRGKIISFVFVKVGEKCIRRPPISLVMVLQGQSKHTGQTQAPLSSGTSSSSPKSESNEFVALPFCSSCSHRIRRSTQVRPKLLCLQEPQALIQSQRAMELSPCHFARHGLTGSVEAHRPVPSSFAFMHPKL